LLTEYAENGCEQSFRELTARYVNLVYSTAVRLMDGDTHRAEDVVQTVFMDLARLAGTLSPDVMLGGWLHRRACHVAAGFIRSERRRQNRERQAAQMNALDDSPDSNLEQIAPALDDAINHLNASDRAAILLRYFEARDFRSVGAALGTSEDAAQKRVSRALEKLRVLLRRRGVTASGALLSSALSAHSATVAPLSLAASVSSAALASVSSSGGLTLTILKLTTMAKIKLAAGVAAAAVLGTTLVLEHKAWAALRDQHQGLQQQIATFAKQEAAGQAQSNKSGPAGKPVSLHAAQLAELERLRGELGALRQQAGELATLRAENGRLRNASFGGESADPAEAEFAHETRRRMYDLKTWGLIFRVYAGDHQGQFPDTWEQVAEQIPAPERESFMKFAKDNFEITYHGDEQSLSNHWETILFREKQARRAPTGKLVKVYGGVDGSGSTRSESGGNFNFETFEQQYILKPH